MPLPRARPHAAFFRRSAACPQLVAACLALAAAIGGFGGCNASASTDPRVNEQAGDERAATDVAAVDAADTHDAGRSSGTSGAPAGDKPGDIPDRPPTQQNQPLPCETSPEPTLPERGLGKAAHVPECGLAPLPIKSCGPCFGGKPTLQGPGVPKEVCVDPGMKFALQLALNNAVSGTTICVRPGVHLLPIDGAKLSNVHDVQIIGAPGAIVSGQLDAIGALGGPASSMTWTPTHEDFAAATPPSDWKSRQCLRLQNVKNVAVRRLQFRACVGKGVVLKYAEQVWLDQLDFERGWKAIVLIGSPKTLPAPRQKFAGVRQVVVSHSRWQQDTSSERQLWCGGCGLTWGNVHTVGGGNNGGDPPPAVMPLDGDGCADIVASQTSGYWPGRYEHLDGGFVVGADVQGDVRICRNHVRDAYNAVIFQLSPSGWSLVHTKLAELPLTEYGQIPFSRNIQIHHNTFIRIRDNVFEPEKWMWNWQIDHNVLFNFYRPFSFQWVTGGNSKVFNNVGFNDGHDIGGPRQCTVLEVGVASSVIATGAHDVSAIFKFADHGDGGGEGPNWRRFTHPIWVFHNTWLHAGDVFNRTLQGRQVKHCNNRVLWREGDPQPHNPLCTNIPETRRLQPIGFHGADEANTSGTGGWHDTTWSISNDATNIYYAQPPGGTSLPTWVNAITDVPNNPLNHFGTCGALDALTQAVWIDRVSDEAPGGVIGSLAALAPPSSLVSVPTTRCGGFTQLPGGPLQGQVMGALTISGHAQTLKDATGVKRKKD